MPRLTEVPRSDVTAAHVLSTYTRRFGDQDPAAHPDREAAAGSWWTVFALDPEVFQLILNRHQWQKSERRMLDPTLRELALARTGWTAESVFVYSQHSKELAKMGVSEERINGLSSWSTQSCYSNLERLVLAYTDDLVLGRGRVADGHFAALRMNLSDVAILELTYMVTTYIQSSVIARALRLESDDVPDRVSPVRVSDFERPVRPSGGNP